MVVDVFPVSPLPVSSGLQPGSRLVVGRPAVAEHGDPTILLPPCSPRAVSGAAAVGAGSGAAQAAAAAAGSLKRQQQPAGACGINRGS